MNNKNKEWGLLESTKCGVVLNNLDATLELDCFALQLNHPSWYINIEFKDSNLITQLRIFFQDTEGRTEYKNFVIDTKYNKITFHKDDEFEDRYFIDLKSDNNFVQLTLINNENQLSKCFEELEKRI